MYTLTHFNDFMTLMTSSDSTHTYLYIVLAVDTCRLGAVREQPDPLPISSLDSDFCSTGTLLSDFGVPSNDIKDGHNCFL